MMHDRDDVDENGLLADLRMRAEEEAKLLEKEDPASLSVEEARGLLHELRVHQIELEMQNEELRRAQVALDGLRARYFDLYEMAPVGYVTVSEDGVIREANLRASTMLGTPRDDLDEHPLTQFVVAEDQDIYYRHRKQLIDTGEPQVCELRMKPSSGAELWVRMEATTVRDNDKGAWTCRVTMSDITETQNLQANLARTERMASLGVLAAGVAHEINNPLTYILYDLETLLGDLPRFIKVILKIQDALLERVGGELFVEIAGEDANMIDAAALVDLSARAKRMNEGIGRIESITKGLKGLSRVDQEKLSMVDLNHAAQKAIDITANEIKCRAVIRRDLGRLPGIMASESKLVQIFLNLIINASHAIREGAVEDNSIRIHTWADDDHVFARVTDTGCGIPNENLERIFEPFFTTKSPKRGTGLGLATTRHIVSGFGGDIRVESTVGKGTDFLLRFPIGHDKVTRSPSISPETGGIRGRILVVDDEALILEVLVGLLGRNHEILAVDSGRAAKEILKTDTRFDLILCDLMMPELTGVDLHAWLAEHRPRLARQLVFMTGGVFTPQTDEYLDRVANILIEKPFDKAGLLTLVSEQIIAARSER